MVSRNSSKCSSCSGVCKIPQRPHSATAVMQHHKAWGTRLGHILALNSFCIQPLCELSHGWGVAEG